MSPRTQGLGTGILTGSWPLGMPTEGGFYTRLARQVEARGYDLLFHGDHLFMYGPNPDVFAVLAAYAAVTTTVRLGTGVLLLPLREPVVVAKQAATVDYLSGGRLVLGVGVGGEIDQEWRAMGVPTAGRGARADEYLHLLRALWSGSVVDHRGALRTVTGVVGTPAPVQAGGPPLWVGGRSDAALRRASRHQGWCAYASSPRRVRDGVERIAEMCGGRLPADFSVSYVLFTAVDDDAGRARELAARVLGTRYRQDFDHFLDALCAVGDPDIVRARVEAYRAAGVDDVLICPQVPAAAVPDQVDRVADLLGLDRLDGDAGSG